MKLRRLAAATLVAGLALTACSGGDQQAPSAGGNAEVGSDQRHQPAGPATLQEGGNLRLALTGFPANFNTLHIDGNHRRLRRRCCGRPCRARSASPPTASTTVNTDYFTNVELTGTNPQVVTYTINPKAVWSDGTPITWEDIASQINATSGKDKDFAIASPNGSDRVASVTRGVDDRQAVMTFAKPYAEWQGMFAGNTMLLPKSVTATPEAFNKGSARPARTVGGTVHRHRARPHRAANHVDPQPEVVGHHAAARQHHLPRCSTTPPAFPRCRTTRIDASGARLARRADDRPAHRRHRDPARTRHRAGTTSPSTARRARSWPTRRCGWPSPRASTGRPSPTSPSAAWSTTRRR